MADRYFVAIMAVLLAAVFAFAFGVSWVAGELECAAKVENNTVFVAGDFRLFGGCFVELEDGTRMNYDRYRFEDTDR